MAEVRGYRAAIERQGRLKMYDLLTIIRAGAWGSDKGVEQLLEKLSE